MPAGALCFLSQLHHHRASRAIDSQKVLRVFYGPHSQREHASRLWAIQQFLFWCERSGCQNLEEH
jgi:hypothetical protein